MGETTGISWCDATFNPWVGCSKVSPGCLGAHCYAEALVTGRMGREGTWGEEGVRERTSEGNWRKPLAWARTMPADLGRRPRVFCASLADVFEPRPELDPWRSDLFDLVARTPELDWLILTKRPDFARDWLRQYYVDNGARGVRSLNAGQLDLSSGILIVPDEVEWETFGREWKSRDGLGWGILPNVWMGTSIENSRHTFRADHLRKIPAAVRFISAEPLLGSLYPAGTSIILDEGYIDLPGIERPPLPAPGRRAPLNLEGIDWVIVGGESGGKDARPMHPAWAREIRDAVLDQTCDECAGSTWDTPPRGWEPGEPCHRCSGTGREDTRPALHMKQFGSHDENGVYRGPWPTSGGCLLDGVEWKEFPGVPVAV